MADISKLKLPNGSEYDLKVYTDHIAPMMSKTFQGVIGTANDFANATFYYGSIRPDNWYQTWGLKYRIKTYVPGRNGYVQVADVQLYGDQGFLRAFSSFNSIGTSCAYYHDLYRLKIAGYNNGYGHALGVSIRTSNKPTDTGYKRTFIIDILETSNCTFTFFDECLKYSSIPGTGSTNYDTYSEINYINQGLQETGDANDPNYQNRIYYSNPGLKAYAAGGRYTLTFTKDDNYVLPITSTDNSYSGGAKIYTTESFNPFGQIYYRNSSGAIAANVQVGNATLYRQIIVDARYSFTGVLNGASSVMSANHPVYLVCVPQEDGSAKLAENPLSFELPDSEDGLYYILLGYAYNTYQFELLLNHPVYQYKNGKIFQLNKNNEGSLIRNIPVNNKNTISGTIVTFSDGMNAPVENLIVEMNPIQDLHGQDAPYPAGGGKNLFDEDTVYAAYKQEDGSFICTGAQSTSIRTPIPEKYIGKTMTFSAIMRIPSESNITNIRAAAKINDATHSDTIVSGDTYTLSSVTFTPETAEDYVFLSYGSNGTGKIQFKDVQLELGSTATAYAPYENICPISGRTEVTVTRTGKNLLTSDISAYSTDKSYKYINGVVPEGQVARFTFFDKDTTVSLSGINIGFVQNDLSATGVSGTYRWVINNGVISNDTRNVSSSGVICSNVFVYPKTEEALSAIFARYYVMVELGITASSAFVPYQAQSATVQLGQTVYGGTLDVVSGKLTMEWKSVDMATLNWVTSSTRAKFVLEDAVAPPESGKIPTTLMFSAMTLVRANSTLTEYGQIAYLYSEGANTLLAYYNGTLPAGQVVYKLATPFTIQLTPAQLSTLRGQNNVWSDGDSVMVGYINNVGVFIPEASKEKPGLMSVADKIKLNNTSNHIIISATQPTNQKAGDYWFVLDE